MQWKVIYSVISINKVIANESLKSLKKKGQSVSDSVFLDKEKGGEGWRKIKVFSSVSRLSFHYAVRH